MNHGHDVTDVLTGVPTDEPVRSIGVIGYGEVGELVSDLVADAGLEAWVINRSPDELADRLADSPVDVAPSIENLVDRSDLVVSTVWPATAPSVAETIAESVAAGTPVVDLNSISPGVAVEIRDVLDDRGAEFYNGVIMNSVAKNGADAETMLAGPDADAMAASLNDLGLNVAPIGTDVTRPSAIKLCRSVFTKGLRGLYVEMLVLARQYDVEDETLGSLAGFFEEQNAAEWGQHMLEHGHAHAERRSGEIEYVLELFEENQLQPKLAEAILEIHRTLATYEGDHPAYADIVTFFEGDYRE